MRRIPRQTLNAAGVLFAAALLVAAYANSQRPYGDANLAIFAIENAGPAVVAADPSADLASALDVLAQSDEALALFQISRSADRLPETGAAMRRADLALDAAFELRRFARMGIDRPSLVEAPALAEAIAAMPELSGLAEGNGYQASVDTGDPRVFETLESRAASELESIEQEMGIGAER